MNIHKTAIIDSKAIIHPSVKIGAFSIIDGEVEIGENTEIYPQVHITGSTKIGKNNKIYNGAVIGHIPQDVSYDKNNNTGIIIGDDNIIREYVTIHISTKNNEYTRIGNHNFLMVGVHVAHDCVIEDDSTLVNNVSLGGHVHVEKKAFISGHVGIHQFCRIGAYSMIGSCEKISQDVVPFMTINDFPARTSGINLVGLKRAGFSPQRRANIHKAYKIIFKKSMSIKSVVESLENHFDDEDVEYIREFIKYSANNGRGILR